MRPDKVAAPNLPTAPREYETRYLDQLNNVLRLFFNRLVGLMNQLIDPNYGGSTLYFPYGSYYSTLTQTVPAAATPTLVTINTTAYVSGMGHVYGDGIRVDVAGLYRINYSIQITNYRATVQDMAIWLRKNGKDLPYTDSVITVNPTHGGNPGYAIVSAMFMIDAIAGDKFEFWWAASHTDVKLETLPAITSPFTAPGSPSVQVDIIFVSNV